jgi:hypothetical protein
MKQLNDIDVGLDGGLCLGDCVRGQWPGARKPSNGLRKRSVIVVQGLRRQCCRAPDAPVWCSPERGI